MPETWADRQMAFADLIPGETFYFQADHDNPWHQSGPVESIKTTHTRARGRRDDPSEDRDVPPQTRVIRTGPPRGWVNPLRAR